MRLHELEANENINPRVATTAAAYLVGNITRQEAAEELPDMGHWFLFCKVVKAEGGEI